MWGMKQILVLCAVVVGQSVLAADKKPLITDPVVERAIRDQLNKPTGELTKADLASVTALSLTRTKITDAGLKEVTKLQKLTWLDLSGTNITDAGLKEIAKMQKLWSLHLTDTQITDAGVAELRKALPKCNITH